MSTSTRHISTMPILPVYPPEHLPELVNDDDKDSSLDEDSFDGDAVSPKTDALTPQFGALYWLTRAQELMESISRDRYAFDDDLTPAGLPIIREEDDEGDSSQDSWDEETADLSDVDCAHPVRMGLVTIPEVDEGLEADIIGNGTEAVILIVTAPSTDSIHTLVSLSLSEEPTPALNYFTDLPCTLTRRPRVLKRKAKPIPKPSFTVFVDSTSNVGQTPAAPKTVKKVSVQREGKENLP
jgi:hypothetical protein